MDSHSSRPGDCHVDIGFACDESELLDYFLRIEVVSSSSEPSTHAQYADKDSGDKAPHANYSAGRVDTPVILRVKTFHVSSAILSAKSKLISKLFSTGTEVFDQAHVTIRIKDTEEAAFTELLKFLKSDTLSSTTAPEPLNIMMVAKRFEVDLCVRYCTILFNNMTMTTELALIYLEFLPKNSLAEVQPLIDSAKLFLRSHYKDIITFLFIIVVFRFENELMGFPLSGIEAILSADDLNVTSEDDVFDFVLKWAKKHYPKLERRREILSFRLVKYIRFPYMSSEKLVEVPKCRDLDKKLALLSVYNALVSKLDALFVKASFLHNMTRIQMEDTNGLEK